MAEMNQPFLKIFDSQESVSFPQFISRSIREMRIYRFAWINFVVNSLRMRYRRSALGFVWSLLNPLLVMTDISIVFAVIFKQDLKLFSIYIFSGLAPWWYMSAAILGGCQTLITAEGFLKKVYLPKMLFPLVSVTTETANFIFSLISLYILALILGTRIQATILYLPLAILLPSLVARSDVLGVQSASIGTALAIYTALYAFLSLFFFSQAIEALRPRSAKFFRESGMPVGAAAETRRLRSIAHVAVQRPEEYYDFWRDASVDQLCREVAFTVQSMAANNMEKYRALERVYRGLVALTALTALLLTALAYLGFNH